LYCIGLRGIDIYSYDIPNRIYVTYLKGLLSAIIMITLTCIYWYLSISYSKWNICQAPKRIISYNYY